MAEQKKVQIKLLSDEEAKLIDPNNPEIFHTFTSDMIKAADNAIILEKYIKKKEKEDEITIVDISTLLGDGLNNLKVTVSALDCSPLKKSGEDVPKGSEKDMPSPEQEVKSVKKKSGEILPKKTPLISQNHERAYFNSAGRALEKPAQQQTQYMKFQYAPSEDEGGGDAPSEDAVSRE